MKLQPSEGEVTVDYRACILDGLEEPFTWADVVANCYVCLIDNISSEAVFLGEYFEEGVNRGGHNPNITLLQHVEDVVSDAAVQSLRHRGTVASSLSNVLEIVAGLKVEPFGTDSGNESTPLWAIIRGVDRAYGDYEHFDTIRNRGPLNEVRRDRVGVYFTSPASSIGAGIVESGLKRIPELTFNSQLSYIGMYRRVQNLSLPKIKGTRLWGSAASVALAKTGDTSSLELQTAVPLLVESSDEGERWPAHLPENVRIGMATFSSAQIAGLADSDAAGAVATPLSFSRVHGKVFVASYSEGYDEDFGQVIHDVLETCMDNACDIIVFPELVISEGLRTLMQKQLQHTTSQPRPALVVAGSSWMPGASEARGNNVAFLYDGYGHEIGRYYKCSGLVLYDADDSTALVEGLESPGKECTIVDAGLVGRVLPSICRDLASESRYTLDLAKAFEPNIVCVPAMSESMDKAFSNPAETLSERSLAISCICNQCGFITRQREGGTVVTSVIAPLEHAEGSTRTRVKFCNFLRDGDCRSRCLAHKDDCRSASCIHIIDVDCKSFAQEKCVTGRRIPLHRVNR